MFDSKSTVCFLQNSVFPTKSSLNFHRPPHNHPFFAIQIFNDDVYVKSFPQLKGLCHEKKNIYFWRTSNSNQYFPRAPMVCKLLWFLFVKKVKFKVVLASIKTLTVLIMKILTETLFREPVLAFWYPPMPLNLCSENRLWSWKLFRKPFSLIFSVSNKG